MEVSQVVSYQPHPVYDGTYCVSAKSSEKKLQSMREWRENNKSRTYLHSLVARLNSKMKTLNRAYKACNSVGNRESYATYTLLNEQCSALYDEIRKVEEEQNQQRIAQGKTPYIPLVINTQWWLM